MEPFIAYIIQNLVEHPDSVKVLIQQEGNELRISLQVHPDDLGKVIGRSGKTIQAVRTIVATVAARHGFRSRVEVRELGESVGAKEANVHNAESSHQARGEQPEQEAGNE